ncbi:Radical SAM domain protein [Desulfonatronospira thiodismutans ASO3-1]|uniref:Radical SAM domain protein n=1 Tax=Desulfonatronospira thiodismutans ASO3-1 TaxID=555779 RepID=D6SP99_9BACT|nr:MULTISPECIES: radical SAM protein [Desulfonatronospira]EFI34575.1 Radical SAM domain protein [Desulfonatronospira thiodismutans ASO3-1]RQD76424.1 MAG: radical SAM protein [Desulfonatronospira sp. MSAO_Bac3]
MGLMRILGSWGYPALDWIQVGITTRCNAECIYCPSPVFRKKDPGRHMSMQTFTGLSRAFPRAGLVYLQGWGEPMMHPEFMFMLKMVKDKGTKAGVTSNASLLTDERIRRLVDQGLDVLGLSVAGVDEANDRIRPGSPIKKVRQAVENVHRIRTLMGSSTPALHLAYMLLGSRRGDIRRMPGFFNALAPDQVVVSTLTLALDQEMDKEMYPARDKDDFEEFKAELLDMKSQVDGQEKVFFHVYNPYLPDGPCSENIHRACYVDVDGRVLPCVYTDVSAEDRVYRYFQGRPHPVYPIDFGHVPDDSLKSIWKSRQYRKFRGRFSAGECPEECATCTKRFIDDLTHEDPEPIRVDYTGPA